MESINLLRGKHIGPPWGLFFAVAQWTPFIENTVSKGEIARYEQFLLLTQCFQNHFDIISHINYPLFRKTLSENSLLQDSVCVWGLVSRGQAIKGWQWMKFLWIFKRK